MKGRPTIHAPGRNLKPTIERNFTGGPDHLGPSGKHAGGRDYGGLYWLGTMKIKNRPERRKRQRASWLKIQRQARKERA